MRVAGFLQNRNNVENGYLRRALYSLSLCCDETFVYDDASDENVTPLYNEFGCTVVRGYKQAFERELFHKQDLLYVALRYRPDWIIWIDSDTVLGPLFEDRDNVNQMFESAQSCNYVRLFLHNTNLWRSYHWRRVDCNYDELWHAVLWRNTGQLHYRPVAQLHQRQYPFAFTDDKMNGELDAHPVHLHENCAKLIHFGFANEIEIARKYFLYRAQGQSGGRLDRLVSEGTMVSPYSGKEETFTLEPVDKEWYPSWMQDEIGEPTDKPTPIFTPESMSKYTSFDAWFSDWKAGTYGS